MNGSCASTGTAAGAKTARPMSTLIWSPSTRQCTTRPPVDTVKRVGAAQRWWSQWAKMRRPLPEISATEPSGL